MCCRDCNRREKGCHAICKEYAEYQSMRKAILAAQAAEYITSGYLIENSLEIKRKMRDDK